MVLSPRCTYADMALRNTDTDVRIGVSQVYSSLCCCRQADTDKHYDRIVLSAWELLHNQFRTCARTDPNLCYSTDSPYSK